jgi:phage gpG-like protein
MTFKCDSAKLSQTLTDVTESMSGPGIRSLLQALGDKQVRNVKDGLLMGLDIKGGMLKPSKRAIRDGGHTLVDKGHMIGALKAQADENQATVYLGSQVENVKAIAHQYGTKSKKGKQHLPARPWFGFRPGDPAKLVAEVDLWLKSKIARLKV